MDEAEPTGLALLGLQLEKVTEKIKTIPIARFVLII